MRVGLGERAAENREVLREHVSQAAVDVTPTGDEAIAGNDLLLHAEIAAVMGDQLVQLFERSFVEQQLDAFPRGKLTFLVLPLFARFTATLLRGRVPAAKLVQPLHLGITVAGASAVREFPAIRRR